MSIPGAGLRIASVAQFRRTLTSRSQVPCRKVSHRRIVETEELLRNRTNPAFRNNVAIEGCGRDGFSVRRKGVAGRIVNLVRDGRKVAALNRRRRQAIESCRVAALTVSLVVCHEE